LDCTGPCGLPSRIRLSQKGKRQLNIEDIFNRIDKLTAEGRLTIGDIFHPGFYRLLEGEYANKVVIYTGFSRVDGEPILIFANGISWIWKDNLKGVRCERTKPTFPAAQNPLDLSKATWYSDSGEGPLSFDW
jgi:hypothetical protein